ncbi:MAG: four helix bundle protein [Flavobacteriales bacterium]
MPSNVAEGSSRRSEKEKFRFFEFALGSAFELQTRLLIVQRRNWADENRLEAVLTKVLLVEALGRLERMNRSARSQRRMASGA